jgi:hypothetical protein
MTHHEVAISYLDGPCSRAGQPDEGDAEHGAGELV